MESTRYTHERGFELRVKLNTAYLKALCWPILVYI